MGDYENAAVYWKRTVCLAEHVPGDQSLLRSVGVPIV